MARKPNDLTSLNKGQLATFIGSKLGKDDLLGIAQAVQSGSFVAPKAAVSSATSVGRKAASARPRSAVRRGTRKTMTQRKTPAARTTRKTTTASRARSQKDTK